jgi:NEDD4-binding protein 2
MQNEENVYKFNPKELGNAHQWNQQRTLDSLQKGITPIIVDNTNTQKWEAKFYVEQALEHKYTIIIRGKGK